MPAKLPTLCLVCHIGSVSGCLPRSGSLRISRASGLLRSQDQPRQRLSPQYLVLRDVDGRMPPVLVPCARQKSSYVRAPKANPKKLNATFRECRLF
jgi:hypothetical protein